METDMISIIFGGVEPRLLSSTIISGFLIFFMYFYKSKTWDDFSDFDKLSLSIVCGFVIFMGLVVPISRIFFMILHLSYGFDFYSLSSEAIIWTYRQVWFYILMVIFIIRVTSPLPLCDNIGYTKKIFYAYFVLFWILLAFYFEFVLAILLSDFREYWAIVSNLSWSIFFITIFFGVHISVHKKSFSSIQSYIKRDLKPIIIIFQPKRQKIILLVFLILLPYLVGQCLLNYSVVENEEHVDKILIDNIRVETGETYSAMERIYKDYTIHMPLLVSWAKVKPELTLETDFDDENSMDYHVLKEENAFIVNKTSKNVNVTVLVYKDIDVQYAKLVEFNEIKYENTTALVNISLTNYLPNDLEIKYLEIPIRKGYTLNESDFVKSKFFAENRGGIQDYNVKDGYIYLNSVKIEKNASGIIRLKLIKTDVIQ